MAKNNNLKDYLTDLYEGIATKKTNPSRNPQDFRQEIESIEVGGSGVSVFEGTTDDKTEVVLPITKKYYSGAFIGNAEIIAE